MWTLCQGHVNQPIVLAVPLAIIRNVNGINYNDVIYLIIYIYFMCKHFQPYCNGGNFIYVS